MGRVNDFLVTYLDSIDEQLLAYLDENEELRLDAVRRMRFYATALLDGSITPAALAEDWPDFFDLAPAFVAAYVPEDVEVMEEKATFLEAAERGWDVALTEADRTFLTALQLHLVMYPQM